MVRLNSALESSSAFLYEQIALRIAGLIESGTLRPGERVPSVRKLREQQQVSVATVLQAYRVLEGRGLIEARPQSGYFVRARWQPASELAISRPKPGSTKVTTGELVLRFLATANDPTLAPLGAALPSPDLLPGLQLTRSMSQVARRAPALASAYDISPGSKVLRVQIARRAIEAGCALSPDDIVVTAGCQEAIYLALRAITKPGDTVAVESPTYFGLLQMLASLGLKACEIPTYPRHGICLDELEKRLDQCGIKACVFMLNYQNPLGSCMPEEKKSDLIERLTRRDIPLIEDDINGELGFGRPRPKSAKAYDRAGLVLSCGSFCKTLAPGLRIGWIAPGRYRQQVEHLKFIQSVGTAALAQAAIADFLASGSYERHLRRLRHIYAGQVQRMTDAVIKYFPEGTRVSQPNGGYIVWVELPGSTDSVELFDRALKAGVTFAPGTLFSPRNSFRNCLRLSCGYPWDDRIDRAVLTLGKLAGN